LFTLLEDDFFMAKSQHGKEQKKRRFEKTFTLFCAIQHKLLTLHPIYRM